MVLKYLVENLIYFLEMRIFYLTNKKFMMQMEIELEQDSILSIMKVERNYELNAKHAIMLP